MQVSDTDNRTALQSFASIGPADISPCARENLRVAVTRLAKEFGLSNTPMTVQAHINRDDVKIVEFAPRVGGGLGYRDIYLMTGFDIIDSVVCSYLGEPVNTSSIRTPSEMVSIVHLYGTSGVLDRIEGIDRLLSEGIVEEFHMHKTSGMSMTSDDLASRNRVVGVILRGESIAELQEKTKRMVAGLRIITVDGDDVLNRRAFS